MRHSRHYTLEQAGAARAWAAERVRRIRDAQRALAALSAAGGAVAPGLDPQSGGSYPGRDHATALVTLSRALVELEAVEVVVRDVERGLIDFPAIRDGREVYLCWLIDEDEIGYWHPLDHGFGGRQPL